MKLLSQYKVRFHDAVYSFHDAVDIFHDAVYVYHDAECESMTQAVHFMTPCASSLTHDSIHTTDRTTGSRHMRHSIDAASSAPTSKRQCPSKLRSRPQNGKHVVGVWQDRSGDNIFGTSTALVRCVSGRYSGGEVGALEPAKLACPKWALAAEVRRYG